jgi:cellulose biosynthesis protein BcsQ
VEYRPPTIVVTLAQKGGVGKTTLATSLFSHLACEGYSACIFDLDPQGNATAWGVGTRAFRQIGQGCGVEAFTAPDGCIVRQYSPGMAAPTDASAAHVAARTPDADDAAAIAEYSPGMVPPWAAPHVMPCTTLGRGFVVAANQFMAVHRFTDVFVDMVPFDYVIVDTPPHLPVQVFRALVRRASAVVAPVQPERYALQNVPDLLQEMAHGGGHDLLERDALRLVVNMRQKCANHDAWETVLREHWQRYVSPVVIPRATAWQDAANALRPWNPKSVPGKTAAALWQDITKSMQRRKAA